MQRSGIDTIKYHSFFPAGDHKAHINKHTDTRKDIANTTQNRRAQRYSKHNTEQKHTRSTKEVPPWNSQQNILLEGLNQVILLISCLNCNCLPIYDGLHCTLKSKHLQKNLKNKAHTSYGNFDHTL